MTLDEIEAEARAHSTLYPDGAVGLVLTIPGTWGKRTHARLGGRHGGPKGRILSDLEPHGGQPRILVQFKNAEILAWIKKRRAHTARVKADEERQARELPYAARGRNDAPYHPVINPNGANPDEFGGSDF